MNEQGCLGHAHLELLISPTRQPGKHLPAWICLINPGAGKVIKLGRERKSADIVLDSSDGQHWISRTHAIFAYDTGAMQWTMADNSSLNGTYVDGIRLAPNTPHILRDGCVVTVGGQENHKPGEQLVGEMECTYVFNDRPLADLEPLLCAACGQLPVLAHTATCSQYALSSQVQAMRDRMSICNHYRSHFCLTCGDELAAWGDPCPVCAQALALPLHPCGVIDTLIGRTQLPPAAVSDWQGRVELSRRHEAVVGRLREMLRSYPGVDRALPLLNVNLRWGPDDQAMFHLQMQRLEGGRARRLYCLAVGLTPRLVLKAPKDRLPVIACNIGLKTYTNAGEIDLRTAIRHYMDGTLAA